jgi:hypothetical protein
MTKLLTQIALISLALFSLSVNSARSQAKFIWGKQSGTEKEEYVLNHVTDSKGNIYVSGKTTGDIDESNFGKNDGFLIKYDSTGNIIWSRQFGTTEDEDILWSAIDGKDCIYITGTTRGVIGDAGFGKEDIFVAKYTSVGLQEWIKQIGTDSTDICQGIYAGADGFIYLTGATGGLIGKSSFGKTDCFIMKLDTQGNIQFTKQIGTPVDDYGISITGDGKSRIFICGSTWGDIASKSKGMIDAFAGVYTDKGELVKMIQFGTEGFDMALQVAADENANLYVGGSTSGNLDGIQSGEGDCFLTKIDAGGKILWSRQFGTNKHDGVRGLASNNSITDNILVSGIMNLPPSYAFVRMYSPDGDLLMDWNYNSGETKGETSGKDVTIDNNGNIYHLGLTGDNLYGKLIGEHDFYLVKLRLESKFRNH